MIITITSSANRLILCSIDPILKPVIDRFVLICSARGSIMRLKISGESGHPCRVPLVILNGLDSISELYT